MRVAIIGAGPAGITTALFLAKFGIRCTLLDKATFPRDKVCGESYDGYIYHVLKKIDDSLVEKIISITQKSFDYQLVLPNGVKLVVNFPKTITPRFLAKRIDFDNALVDYARNQQKIDFKENYELIDFFKNDSNAFKLNFQNGEALDCDLVVWSCGANQKIFPKKQTQKSQEYVFLRGYYKTKFPHGLGKVTIKILNKKCKMCFVICPVSDNEMNVELGVKQSDIISKSLNVKDIFNQLCKEDDLLKDAILESKLVGTSMFLGDKERKFFDDNQIFIGDVAGSVNPITGYGVGHAMVQGMITAEIISEYLDKKGFSISGNLNHRIYHKLNKEFTESQRITHLMNWITPFSWLMKISFFRRKFIEKYLLKYEVK
jgi:flavin-dependent dehydrogenase